MTCLFAPNNRHIVFNKSGYDPFIDFLKAYAIIMVVFTHCIPASVHDHLLGCLWIDVQVPLFLFIQVFHAYKNNKKPEINANKIISRIVLPFVIIQIAIFVVLAVFSKEYIANLLEASALGGGYGPGSYYFWVYIQFAFLLRWAYPYLVRHEIKKLTIVFVIISITIDIICSTIHMPESLYRLLTLRYIFLILLGYIWVKRGIVLNKLTIALSLFSISATLFFSYTHFDLEPLFFNTGWKNHRWICYYFMSTVLIFVLKRIYDRLSNHSLVDKVIRYIGKCSYDIYIFQMAVFTLFPINLLSFIDNDNIRMMIWIIMAFSGSIIGGILFFRLRLLFERNILPPKSSIY